jgi:quercetin dioxygenase-like cupin family protein
MKVGFFEDERGLIRDLFDGDPVHATWISTREGAIRGTHVHNETVQWTLVTKGELLMASGSRQFNIGPGKMFAHLPGEPHAWKALVDSECYVFTLGPRGKDFESDTIRLKEPLLT